MSRTAIWKRIERLRACGYQVEGSSRRGYRLEADQDLLLATEIMAGLDRQRLAGPVWHFVTLPSTNDLAKDLARRGYPEGMVLVAETQSAGRGRLGRVWESPPGTGIYLSLLLRPPLPPTELPKLTLTAAVAVVEALKEVTALEIGIKWPNDIIFGGKKLGGILTEMETESDQMSHVILGVGLNINTLAFPDHLAGLATSLGNTGRTYSRLAIVKAFLAAMDRWYGTFLDQGFGEILAAWRREAVTLGKPVRVPTGGPGSVGSGDRCCSGRGLAGGEAGWGSGEDNFRRNRTGLLPLGPKAIHNNIPEVIFSDRQFLILSVLLRLYSAPRPQCSQWFPGWKHRIS